MGKIFALDECAQERTIRNRFLFRPSVLSSVEQDFEYVVLLDRDGTIIRELEYLRNPEQVEFETAAQEAIRSFADLPVFVAVVSNQSGLAKGIISNRQFAEVNHRFLLEIQERSLPIHAVIYCPFHENGTLDEYSCNSPFRKPETGMFRVIRETFSLAPKKVFMVGDQVSDVEFGNRLHAQSYFVTTGHGKEGLARLKRSQLDYKIECSLYDAVGDIAGQLAKR